MHLIIDDIITSFSREELREFKYFLSGNSNIKEERQDIATVDRIRKQEPGTGSSNKVYQTRRRIKKQLELFLQNENLKADPRSVVMNALEVAKYLFRKNLYKQAWYYLKKAEDALAGTSEYELLDFVYYNQIAYVLDTWSYTAGEIGLAALLKKRDHNARLAKSDSDANAAYTSMLLEIRELFSREVYGNIDDIIRKVLRRYQLEDRIYDSPRIYSKIVNMVCRAFREKKDYAGLKVYSVSSYREMKKKRMLKEVPTDFLLELIRSVYQSSVRTLDYTTATTFWKIYDAEKEKLRAQHDKYIYYDFRARIMSADLALFTGRLDDAGQMFRSLQAKYATEHKNAIIYFLLRINLLAFHFNGDDHEACLKVYSGLIRAYQKDVLKEEGLGLEMLLFTEIYGAIFHYESGDHEYTLYLLNRIRRKYSGSFSKKLISREMFFLRIMEKMIRDPAYVTGNRFRNDCRRFVALKEYVPGDKEYISLAAWLQSRLYQRSYYQCFLSLVGKKQTNHSAQ